MGKTDKKIDAYIAKAAPFAKPVLIHLRKLVHECCPAFEEKIKWSFPHFDYKGSFCSMAAFKEHCAFNFWKSSLMADPNHILQGPERDGMGHLGKIRGLDDLPSDKILKAYIREAIRINEEGLKLPPRVKTPDSEKEKLKTPAVFANALKKNKKAEACYQAFSYSQKKEYIDWITEAKTAETREKRINTALEWISEGKIRNWKYLRK